MESPNPKSQSPNADLEPVLDDKPVVDISDEKLMAALSYVGVLVLIPLFTRKRNPYVYFHAKQGLVIMIGEVVALIAGQWIAVVGSVVFVLLLIASVVGLIQALQGRRFRIPGIAEIADKFSV